MARKKGSRRANRGDESDDDTESTASTASYEVMENRDEVEEEDESTVLEDYIDSLYEKRSSTREAGLKGLIAAFTGQVLTDFAESKLETLLQQFVNSVKRGSASEVALAARALGLLAITLGASTGAEHVLEEAAPALTVVAKTNSASTARSAALESLAILTFVSAPDTEATEQTMKTLWQIGCHAGSANASQKVGASPPSPPVRAMALTSWSLLLSTIPSDQTAEEYGRREIFSLAEQLRDDDLNVRTAAGEAIALLHEAGSSENRGSDGEDFYGEGSIPEESVAPEEVVEQMRALTIPGASKKHSKRDRLSQKTSFREILSSIQEGGLPKTTVKLKHGDSLQVSTWTQTVQLIAFRKFLAEGFQRHLQENTLLHEIFEYQPRTTKAEGFRSLVEKRLYQSPNSVLNKARTQARTQSRSAARANNQGRFHASADEDL